MTTFRNAFYQPNISTASTLGPHVRLSIYCKWDVKAWGNFRERDEEQEEVFPQLHKISVNFSRKFYFYHCRIIYHLARTRQCSSVLGRCAWRPRWRSQWRCSPPPPPPPPPPPHIPPGGANSGTQPLPILSPIFRSPHIFLILIFFGGIFSFSFVLYSALLRLPPLGFHCADGCWDRTQDRCNWCIGSQTL